MARAVAGTSDARTAEARSVAGTACIGLRSGERGSANGSTAAVPAAGIPETADAASPTATGFGVDAVPPTGAALPVGAWPRLGAGSAAGVEGAGTAGRPWRMCCDGTAGMGTSTAGA